VALWTPDGLKPVYPLIDLTGLTSYSFGAGQGLNLVDFREYRFELEGVLVVNDGTDLWLRLSGASGSTDYSHGGNGWNSGSSTVTNLNNGGGAAQINLTAATTMGSVAANELGASGSIRLVNARASGAVLQPSVQWMLSYRDTSGVLTFNRGRAFRNAVVAVTSVDFRASDGAAFEKGTISVYAKRRLP